MYDNINAENYTKEKGDGKMIRDVSSKLLNLIKDNNGLEKNKINSQFGMDMQKIIDIILGECRCSIIDEKGNYVRYGSSTDIRIIKILVQIFLSNSNIIPPEVVSIALTKEGVYGPFKKINIEKKYNERVKFYEVEMEDVFPNEFNAKIFENNAELKEEFLNNVVRPYVKNIIYSNDVLMAKSPIGAYFSKIFSNQKTDEQMQKELTQMLEKALQNTNNQELIENISNYIFTNIMNNKYFKDELVSRALGATELQKLGRIYSGFGSLVDSMSYQTVQMVELRSFPYGEMISIKDTFYTTMAVLTALATNLEGLNGTQILNKIEETNRNYNITNKTKKAILEENLETESKQNLQAQDSQIHNCTISSKYRNTKIENNKYGSVAKYVEPENISKAMENICSTIEVLLQGKEKIEKEEYFRNVLKIHYRLIRIQPFNDANGRTARAITNMLLQSIGMIGIFRKEMRKEYINYINEADKIVKPNEEKYLRALVENPAECSEIENEILNLPLPFLVVKN